MAQPFQHNSIDAVLELPNQQGKDSLREALRILLNAAMLPERQHFPGVKPYERPKERRDYARGFKLKRLRTRVSG